MRYKNVVSQVASRTGLLWAFEQLPSQPGVVVFAHHRIGNRDECEYNRDLFSASADQFDYQLSYIKRHIPTLLPHELAELMERKKRLTRLHAIITFDDGYLDNYTLAFQLLKQHDLRAAFFLATSFVGSSCLPWWDEIAYLVRNTRWPFLSVPCSPITIDLRSGREQAISQLVEAYKSEDNCDPAAFMQQLRAEAQVPRSNPRRQFLDWNEAREMASAGMEIGAHTHTHPILSRLTERQQRAELQESKAVLELNLGLPVTSFAYPNGGPGDFTAETQRIARNVGFTTAFSYYGGINPADSGENFNILRIAPRAQPHAFRAELAVMSRLGRWNLRSNGSHSNLQQDRPSKASLSSERSSTI
ncbi:MAG TPA: polysaccharide deacetylase family protein [Edaphobacter sp.]